MVELCRLIISFHRYTLENKLRDDCRSIIKQLIQDGRITKPEPGREKFFLDKGIEA